MFGESDRGSHKDLITVLAFGSDEEVFQTAKDTASHEPGLLRGYEEDGVLTREAAVRYVVNAVFY